jgi:hypothetical protein
MILWYFVLGQTLLVTSAQDCPSAAAIDARVRETLGLRANEALEERATVNREGSTLTVTLRGKDGRVLGERSLAAQGNCAELANVVAVVLSAWLSDVHPEFVASLPEAQRPSNPPAAPRIEVPVPPPSSPPEPRRETSGTSFAPRRGMVGAAVGAALSAEVPAPLATIGLRWVPSSGLGASATATIIAARSEPLSTGSVRYWRWPLLLGPAWRVPLGSTALDLEAGAAFAWLHLEGNGFISPATHDAFLGGGFFSTRISFVSDRFEPFAELTGVLWGSTHAFVRRGADQVAVGLPGLELYVAFGASLRAW